MTLTLIQDAKNFKRLSLGWQTQCFENTPQPPFCFEFLLSFEIALVLSGVFPMGVAKDVSQKYGVCIEDKSCLIMVNYCTSIFCII